MRTPAGSAIHISSRPHTSRPRLAQNRHPGVHQAPVLGSNVPDLHPERDRIAHWVRRPPANLEQAVTPRRLLPGKAAGQHQHPKSMMGRLNGLGIRTRASPSTAMLHPAATVPPAVFATLIGISTGATTKWADCAGSNWTTYAPSARRSRPAHARTQ